MLRLIAVGVVVTCSMMIAAPVPKPTERELKARWGEIWAIGDDDGGTFHRSLLTLHSAPRDWRGVPAEDWDAITESVRTVREVSGDFEMTVTLSWDEVADVDRYDGEWNAGLYAQNRATCVTNALRGYSKNPAKAVRLVSGSNWSTRGREVGWMNFDIRPTANRLLLRLRREGEVLYTGTSADGEEWREWKVGTDQELLSLDETVNVGVFIRPNSQRKTVATFSGFKLATGKK